MAFDKKSYVKIMQSLIEAMRQTMLAAGADKGAVDKLMAEISAAITGKK
jgi:hypothetical protein